MRQRRILLAAVAVAAVIAAATMLFTHGGDQTAKPTQAQIVPAGNDRDIEVSVVQAIEQTKVRVTDLSVRHVGGIVVLRGAADAQAAVAAVDAVKRLGFTRVANLIRPVTFDDEGIRREAERQLSQVRALDGCMLKVSCERGVLSVSGTVQSELQADAARQILKNVSGAQKVQVDLNKI